MLMFVDLIQRTFRSHQFGFASCPSQPNGSHEAAVSGSAGACRRDSRPRQDAVSVERRACVCRRRSRRRSLSRVRRNRSRFSASGRRSRADLPNVVRGFSARVTGSHVRQDVPVYGGSQRRRESQLPGHCYVQRDAARKHLALHAGCRNDERRAYADSADPRAYAHLCQHIMFSAGRLRHRLKQAKP